MALTLTDYDAVLKDYYTPDRLADLSFYDNPLFGMLTKKRAGGRRYVQPVEFQHPGGGGADFTKAKNNQTKSRYDDFLITRVPHYQLVTLENEVIEASMTSQEAFRPAFDEFDRGFRGAGENIARKLYRTTGGAIGRISSSTNLASQVIVLTDVADAFNYYIGQLLVFSSADGGGSLRDSGDTLEVTNISYEDGQITVAEVINTVTGIQANDFIFTDGDYGESVAGLESWLPVTDRAAKLAASFFGVTRNTHVERLGGIYLAGAGMGLDEILITLSARIAKHGGRPDCGFLNPETMSQLMLLWESRKRVFQPITTAITPTIGYEGFQVNTGTGTIRLYPDRSCPSNRLYLLQKNTWTIWHAGDLPGYLNKKAGSIIRVMEDEDAYEARVGAYLNLGCKAPGFNGVASLT